MHESSASPPSRWKPALHLIWAMPITLIVSSFLLFMSALTWCGVSGCSGAGFGRISDPNVPAAVALLFAAGAIVGLPIALIPWSRRKPIRWVVAAVILVVVCGVGYEAMWP